MISAELKTNYRTNYHLELIDSRSGKIKQKADTQNIILDNWWNSARNEYCSGRLVHEVVFGSGSGTPAESDTGPFHSLWTVAVSSERQTIDEENKAITCVAFASIPATSAYVGTITEICCTSRATAANGNQWPALKDYVFTHALLKDAEGNPISIEKTDVDILEVTITITVSYSASSPWVLNRLPGYLLKKKGAVVNSANWADSQWFSIHLALGTTNPDPDFFLYNYDFNRANIVGPSCGNACSMLAVGSLSKATRKMSFANTRIAQEVGQSRPIYYNYVMVEGFMYSALPNADIFPSYTISNISIGKGDGVKTQFDNPLDYFVKDTEKVYKNGVALVRGTDYTIDYQNNHNRLPELAATRNCKTSGGVTVAAGSYGDSGPKRKPFQRFVRSANMYLLETISVGWNANNPLFIEFEEAGDVNTFYVPSWVSTGTITLFRSADGENWTQVCEIAHTSGTANTEKFSAIKAQYWKIEGTNTGWTNHSYTTDDMAQELFLGYVGDPDITFTEAPADGDVITMDVEMDRPFKNGNFVIDVAAELQLS